jgi:hypothetical protein
MTNKQAPARRWSGGRGKYGTDGTSNSYPHSTSGSALIQPHVRVSGGPNAN